MVEEHTTIPMLDLVLVVSLMDSVQAKGHADVILLSDDTCYTFSLLPSLASLT